MTRAPDPRQPPDPPSADRAAGATWLRTLLRARGYVPGSLASLGDLSQPGALARAVAAFDASPQDAALKAILKLFVLGVPVDRAAARAALAPNDPTALVGAGLLDETGEAYAPRASLMPHANFLTAADHVVSDAHPGLFEDHVLAVGNATILAAELTVRPKASLAVDVGSGQGLLTLLAARHAARAIGIDTSPRAVAFARFNAALNEVANAEFVQGSLLDPVREHAGAIDLIVTNPPFIITPEDDPARRAAYSADGVVERLAREGPAMLAPGGWMTMVCAWTQGEERDWSERPRSWLLRNGCDALVMRFNTVEAGAYAHQIMDMPGADPGQTRRAWDEYCARHGVRGVTFGAIVLHRVDAPTHWVRAEPMPLESRRGNAGPLLERLFACQRFLWELARPEAVLDASLRATDDIARVTRPGSDGTQVQLQHKAGLALPTNVAFDVAETIKSFDGTMNVRETIAALAQRLGASAPPPERLVPVVHQLVQRAFLAPVGVS